MKKQHPTDELIKILNSLDSAKDLDQVATQAEQSAAYNSFADFISQQAGKKGVPAADLIRGANIQRTYGYQILSGARSPGRDKVLALCLFLTLPLDEVQRALTLAEESVLYPKRRRDSILIFGINQKLSVSEMNDLLFELGEETLCT